MRPINKPIVMLSACLTSNNEGQNDYAHNKMKAELRDMGVMFSEITGVYNGEQEQSFLCTVDEPIQIAKLSKLAWQYSQESILIADQDRNAKLYFVETGDELELGHLSMVENADGLDNYSIVKINGRETYWTTSK